MIEIFMEVDALLIFDSWQEQGPELRAIHSEDRHLIYEGAGVILDLLLKRKRNGSVHVSGQVLPDGKTLATVAHLEVSLQNGRRLHHTHTNALGEFSFAAVTNENLELSITLDRYRIN